MTKKKSSKNQITYNSTVVKTSNNKPIKNASISSRSVTGIKGLQNLGNTCYFNSMLQMLINSPCFLNNLRSYCNSEQMFVAKIAEKEYELVLKPTDVSTVEKELISIWESDKSIISPANLRGALLQHKDFKTHFNGFNEQDSHEVFLMVLNIIKEAQIKRIRGAVLDYFGARKNALIDDETKKKIKEISSVVEKQTLVNNMFGLVIGSNLKCQNCGELRMRFDEVFHMTPVFVTKNEIDKTDDNATIKEDSDLVILKPKNQTVANEKISKHQLKRQKRIEKKTARNKKSVQRDAICSPEDMLIDVSANTNGNVSDDAMSQSNADNEKADSDIENPIVFGGNDEITDENLVMQQLIYDAVTQESMSLKNQYSQCCSSNGSMVARKNDSSRVSISSLTSSIEDILCHQLDRDLSVQEGAIDQELSKNEEDRVYAENNTSVDNNSCRDMMDEDSDVDGLSSAGNIIRVNIGRLPREDVCCSVDYRSGDDKGIVDEELKSEVNNNESNEENKEDNEIEDEPIDDKMKDNSEYLTAGDNVMIIDSKVCSDRSKEFLQSAYSSTLETHQDRLFTCHDQAKVAFEPETDLDRALKRFNAPLFLENIVCDSCSTPKQKIQTHHFKTDVICHLPQILPFYISRFKQCTARNRTKNTTVFSYPAVLNLSSQCSRYANFTKDSLPVLYRLFGIIEHIGARINTGHYVSYVCRPSTAATTADDGETKYIHTDSYPSNMLSVLSRKYDESRYTDYHWTEPENESESDDSPLQYQWFRISDSHVESVSKDTVMHVQAFMLFYSRIQ